MDACFHHGILKKKKVIVTFFLSLYLTIRILHLAILRRKVRIDRKKWASIIKWLDGEKKGHHVRMTALSELKEASCALFFCLGLVQERITSLASIDLQRWQSIINPHHRQLNANEYHRMIRSQQDVYQWMHFLQCVCILFLSIRPAYFIREEILKFVIAPCWFILYFCRELVVQSLLGTSGWVQRQSDEVMTGARLHTGSCGR